MGRSSKVTGHAPIAIDRDEHGVARVRAENAADVFRGLGYCHAADRGLQLVLTRLIGQGRAAEVLEGSDEMVELDRLFRRVNLVGGADAQLEMLSDSHRGLVDAYVDGVNQGMGRHRPWELTLIRHRPEPWTAADSLMSARMIGFVGLAQSQGEVERWIVQALSSGVPLERLDRLFGGRLAGFDESLLEGLRLQPIVPEALAWEPAVPRGAASNNWAVSPSRSATGSALLASDPHLEVNRLPALHYEIVLEEPGGWVTGASFPGVPGIPFGRNEAASWGATYGYGDVIDSWVEDCRDGKSRREDGDEERWEPFKVRDEVILRKGGDAVRERFHENDHGTLEGDPDDTGRYLATRWAGRDSGSRSVAGILDVMRAGSAKEAADHLGKLEWSYNWLTADRDGSIAYRMSGLVPRRRGGVSGLLPLRGWAPEDDWQGFHEPGDLPARVDPPEGFLVTANNDLNKHGAVAPITMCGPSYRSDRLESVLGGRDDWTVEDFGALQMDDLSLQAVRVLEVLQPLLHGDGRFAGILPWDGSYGRTDSAAWFEAFYRAASHEVLTWASGPEIATHLLDDTGLINNFFWLVDETLLDPAGHWAPDEGRDVALRRLAVDALDRSRQSKKPQEMMMGHLMFAGRLPRWLGFDHGPVPVRGGRATVHQSQFIRAGGREVSFAPAYRLVANMGDSTLWTALPGGPSDRRFSRRYTSGISDWVAGRLKALRPR